MSARNKTLSQLATSAGVALLLTGTSLGAAQAGTKLGWVWADQESASETYTPNTLYSFNSAGAANTATRLGTGLYRVVFGNLKTSQTTSVQATAYDSNGYCTVSNWSPEGLNEGVTVNCFNAAGAAADSRFTLLYQSHAGTFGSGAKGTAYLWANQESTASYTPATNYQFNSTGATNTITRNATGSYAVHLPGFDKVGGHVQVTAYGGSAARCKTAGWSNDVSGADVFVLCFDSTGAPSDQQFTLSYSRAMPTGWISDVDTSGVYGWANQDRRVHYKLAGTYQFNGFGTGKLTGGRQAKGLYTVVIPGAHPYNSSNMLVTAYGEDNSYCNITGWEDLGVACYKQGGGKIDSRFDVDFQVQLPVL